MRFAYRIEPGANVDLYLVGVRDGDFNPRHQNCYRWRLTGPKEDNSGTLSDEFAPVVGEIPGAVADGKWHVAQIDLQPSWREFWRKRGYSRPVKFSMRPMFGNLDNIGYLLAGMNGNHAGAAYSVSELKTLTADAADKVAPKVVRTVWPFDPDGDGHSIAIYFEETGSGVAPETLKISFNGQVLNVDPATATATGGAVTFDSGAQCLRLDLTRLSGKAADAAFVLKDGEKYRLTIAPGFTDRAGNANTEGFDFNWEYSAAKVKAANKPVSAPAILFSRTDFTEMKPGDRPLTLAEVTSLQASVRLQRSDATPPWAGAGAGQSEALK